MDIFWENLLQQNVGYQVIQSDLFIPYLEGHLTFEGVA